MLTRDMSRIIRRPRLGVDSVARGSAKDLPCNRVHSTKRLIHLSGSNPESGLLISDDELYFFGVWLSVLINKFLEVFFERKTPTHIYPSTNKLRDDSCSASSQASCQFSSVGKPWIEVHDKRDASKKVDAATKKVDAVTKKVDASIPTRMQKGS